MNSSGWLIAALALSFPALSYAYQPWSVSKVGDITVISQQKEEWGVYFSGSRSEAVFCFVGPMIVAAEKITTVKLKVGEGPWFDAPLVGHDHETLCVMETKKAIGLLGAMVAHGKMSFGIKDQGVFKSVEFDASELNTKIKNSLLNSGATQAP